MGVREFTSSRSLGSSGPLDEAESGAMATDLPMIELVKRHPPPRMDTRTLARFHPPPEEQQEPVHRPYWCYITFLINVAVFVVEIYENGWGFQPMACPASCLGAPCYEDGSPCEANMMIGPRVMVLDRLGAKNDPKIFGEQEWWRVITCNWLHAGILHLAFNMVAVLRLGVDLERAFGTMRIALLYVFAGLFGTVCSIVFLPGNLSVGASASVFGLVGACWADIIVNFCARGTLRNSGIACLTFATLLNVAIGFTPLVDNFMHLGGMVAGLFVGIASFAQTKRSKRTGQHKRTKAQEGLVITSVLVLVVLVIGSFAALASSNVQDFFRSCSFCKHINCIPTPWWNCCVAAVQGGCPAFNIPFDYSTNSHALINVTCSIGGKPDFYASCTRAENDACLWDPSNSTQGYASRQALCSLLCTEC